MRQAVVEEVRSVSEKVIGEVLANVANSSPMITLSALGHHRSEKLSGLAHGF